VRSGIGLAAGCDIAVRGNPAQRQDGLERSHQFGQAGVLRGREPAVVDAFEFDANREIVAALARAPARNAGMPRRAAAAARTAAVRRRGGSGNARHAQARELSE
jgi:hypothetical protein